MTDNVPPLQAGDAPDVGAIPNDREWLISEINDHIRGDHERGCDGRCYSCGCGYDNYTTELLTKAATALTAPRAVQAGGDYVLVPRSVLEFYADPRGKCDQVPDFYDELAFGELAREALSGNGR